MPAEVTLGMGKGLLLTTPCEVHPLSGSLTVWGAPTEGGLRIEIPGLNLLITSDTSAKLEVRGHYRLVRDPIPDEWKEAASASTEAKKIVILGEVDSGKSGLLSYLVNYLSLRGLRVGVVDSDLGQKDLGPPATVAAATFDSPPLHPGTSEPEFIYFVGDTTPRGHLLQVVTGVRRAVDQLEGRSNVILLNTSGYVLGGAARALKYHKVELVEPDIVFVMEGRGEAAHLPKILPPGPEIRVLPSPSSALRKDRIQRAERRRLRWIRYLSGGSEFAVDFSRVRALETSLFTGNSPPEMASMLFDLLGRDVSYFEVAPDSLSILVDGGLSQEERRLLRSALGIEVRAAESSSYDGLLVGLISGETCSGLGLLVRFNPGERRGVVMSKVKEFTHVKFGYIRLSSDFEEVGRREVTAP